MAVAIGVPIALAQTGQNDRTTVQGGAPMTMIQTGTSLGADDHYLYGLGNGQITRIESHRNRCRPVDDHRLVGSALQTTGGGGTTGSTGHQLHDS
ncbi:MAG TPA: hypothetical protein VG944_05760 [Fimbriimonas sp.]|nr:hypothetical protein [Fimbriimonas sp.]